MNKNIISVIGCVAVIFLPGALVFGYPGLMGVYWQEKLNVTQGQVSNSMFFILFALGLGAFYIGKLHKKISTRLIATIGTIVCGVSLLVAAFATSIFMVYLWAFLMGIGSSLIYTPVLTAVQKNYPTKPGLVTGLVNFSFGISAAIMSPVFSAMLIKYDYFSMNLIVFTLTLTVGIIVALFIRDENTAEFAKQNIGSINKGHSLSLQQALKSKEFWMFWSTWAFQGAVGISMISLAVVFGMNKGFDATLAILVLTAFNLTNGFSRIISGILSDYIPRNLLMSLTFALSGLAYIALPQVNSIIVICILVSIIGFAFGTLFACSAPLATECFGLQNFGLIFGYLFTGYGFAAGILGPSISGFLIDQTSHNFIIVFGYLSILSLLSAIMIYFVNPRKMKPSTN
ncbi:MFS transporter [Sporosarcina sp. 179-K 3D1 HS]|uniref:MFS transporter n=1 Tax=Sporosarcina sp. 179-K 3D1 HS TaxID=3232169 RepID=UPI0039A3865F